MYWLAWCTPYRANRKALWNFLRIAIVTFSPALYVVSRRRLTLATAVAHLLDNLHLSIEAGGTTLNQGDVRSQAHLVDMPPRVQVIQGIEDEIEALKPVDVEIRVFDVCVVCFKFNVGIELPGGFFRNLNRGPISRRS